MKRLEKTKEILSNVFDKIQQLTIQATSNNTNIVTYCLNNLQIVYNILDTLEQQIGRDGEDESVSDNG